MVDFTVIYVGVEGFDDGLGVVSVGVGFDDGANFGLVSADFSNQSGVMVEVFAADVGLDGLEGLLSQLQGADFVNGSRGFYRGGCDDG